MPGPKKPFVALTDSLLASSAVRRSFRTDPIAVARYIGVEGLSPGELDALSSLTEVELESLSSIRARIIAANPAAADDTNGYVVF